MRRSKELSVEEYTEPVYYCRDCHSLCIVSKDEFAEDDWDGSYCGKCGSTNVGRGLFGEWLAEEERRDARELDRIWSR